MSHEAITSSKYGGIRRRVPSPYPVFLKDVPALGDRRLLIQRTPLSRREQGLDFEELFERVQLRHEGLAVFVDGRKFQHAGAGVLLRHRRRQIVHGPLVGHDDLADSLDSLVRKTVLYQPSMVFLTAALRLPPRS